MTNQELAAKIQEMNLKLNDGRGLVVLHTIVQYLEMDSLNSAKAIAVHDHDKYGGNEECFPIVKLLIEHGILDVESAYVTTLNALSIPHNRQW